MLESGDAYFTVQDFRLQGCRAVVLDRWRACASPLEAGFPLQVRHRQTAVGGEVLQGGIA